MPAHPTIIRDNQPELSRPLRLLQTMSHDLLHSQELAWRLFLRDLRARYRQSFLGYIWVLVPPLALTASFLLMQKSNLLNAGETPVSYAIFALAGMVFWQTLVDAIMAPINMVNQSKSMLVKLQFPRESLILAGMLQVSFTFIVRLLILLLALLCVQQYDFSRIFLLPLAFISLLILGSMIGVLLSPVSVLYQDISQAMPMLLSFVLVITPVGYVQKTDGFLGILNQWNPATSIVQCGRQAILPTTADYSMIWIILPLSFASLFLGWILYRISLPHLIARIGS